MAAKRRRKSQGDAERPGEGEGTEAAESAEASQEPSGADAGETAAEGAQAEGGAEQSPAETRPARRAEPSAPARNVRELGQHTAATYQQSRDAAADYIESTRQRIREQPVQSLLVAAGVGVLIGLIWR
jgi:ElaB/YqjD/DUF883 family membrane-anchored ribosome-binding protein